jgi:hypothetical protein
MLTLPLAVGGAAAEGMLLVAVSCAARLPRCMFAVRQSRSDYPVFLQAVVARRIRLVRLVSCKAVTPARLATLPNPSLQKHLLSTHLLAAFATDLQSLLQ